MVFFGFSFLLWEMVKYVNLVRDLYLHPHVCAYLVVNLALGHGVGVASQELFLLPDGQLVLVHLTDLLVTGGIRVHHRIILHVFFLSSFVFRPCSSAGGGV